MDNKIFLNVKYSESNYRFIYGYKKYMLELISIGMVKEDGSSYYALSSEFDYYQASPKTRETIIEPIFNSQIEGNLGNNVNDKTFNKYIGKSIEDIVKEVVEFVGENPIFYAYNADFEWVTLASLFEGNLPKTWPKYCRDIAQIIDGENVAKSGLLTDVPKENEYDALVGADWNKQAYKWVKEKLKK